MAFVTKSLPCRVANPDPVLLGHPDPVKKRRKRTNIVIVNPYNYSFLTIQYCLKFGFREIKN